MTEDHSTQTSSTRHHDAAPTTTGTSNGRDISEQPSATLSLPPVHHGMLFPQEAAAASLRVATAELDQLTFGPVSAIGTASAAIFAIGTLEGHTQLRPASSLSSSLSAGVGDRMKFVLRYAAAQVIPSVIWGTQPAHVVAQHIKMDTAHLYSSGAGDMPTGKILRINRLTALRGAVAGSVLLSQVLSLTNLIQQCRKRYSDRIFAGKEPPLEASYENDGSSESWRPGVVVRLAGIESDVTNYSMGLMGRRRLWPIFEDPTNATVKSLVRQYGAGSEITPARVPIFWQVDSGQYSLRDSWRGLSIPKSWLFTSSSETQATTPKLIIEADATPGDGSSFLARDVLKFDLDLREVGQAFHQLALLAPDIQTMCPGDEADNPEVLRVLLVDEDSPMVLGSGQVLKVRDFAAELGLADVIIDSRMSVVRSLTSWLDGTYARVQKDGVQVKKSRGRRPVILETHSQLWYLRFKEELRKHGYETIDRHDVKEVGSIPVLVFERTSADTVNRIRALVTAGITKPENVCALLQDHRGLDELRSLNMPQVSFICPSQIYHDAFAFVRSKAMKGHSVEEIQDELDKGKVWDDLD